MEITTAGDSALILRVCEDAEAASESCGSVIFGACERLRAARIPGVVEIAPAYASVGIFYDPLRLAAGDGDAVEQLSARILSVVAGRRAAKPSGKSRKIKIPVCCERDFARDLDEGAAHAGITMDAFISRYCAVEYRVRCVGFTPGFPYLTGLPPELTIPRRAAPRQAVPAGSVAIGGAQTGIYPAASPGGWNVIGRTPLPLFSVGREEPSLLRAGDRVRFVRISSAQFEQWNDEH